MAQFLFTRQETALVARRNVQEPTLHIGTARRCGCVRTGKEEAATYRSSSHFQGAYSVFRRHLFKGINRLHKTWYLRAARVAIAKREAGSRGFLRRRRVVRCGHSGKGEEAATVSRPKPERTGCFAPPKMIRTTLARAAGVRTPMMRFPDRRAPKGKCSCLYTERHEPHPHPDAPAEVAENFAHFKKMFDTGPHFDAAKLEELKVSNQTQASSAEVNSVYDLPPRFWNTPSLRWSPEEMSAVMVRAPYSPSLVARQCLINCIIAFWLYECTRRRVLPCAGVARRGTLIYRS